MFERFFTVFASERASVNSVAWNDPDLMLVRGYGELLGRYAGTAFNGGEYRLHSAVTGPACQELVDEVFPEFQRRSKVFAMDWMGRQFGVDFARVVDGEPQILLFDPGYGDCFEIPTSFVEFHNVELVESPEAVLAHELYVEWRSHGSDDVIPSSKCVGLIVPLFLGGAESLANLEMSDLEVYWSLMGQMRQGIGDLPDGTVVNQTTIG